MAPPPPQEDVPLRPHLAWPDTLAGLCFPAPTDLWWSHPLPCPELVPVATGSLALPGPRPHLATLSSQCLGGAMWWSQHGPSTGLVLQLLLLGVRCCHASGQATEYLLGAGHLELFLYRASLDSRTVTLGTEGRQDKANPWGYRLRIRALQTSPSF